MTSRCPLRGVFLAAAMSAVVPGPGAAWAEAASGPDAPTDDVRLSVIYTGRSLGALGALQDPDEHELLVEEASRAGVSLRLDTHRCWRAPGVVVFSPDSDLDDLPLTSLIAGNPFAEELAQPALVSNNVTIIQDPRSREPDLLAMLMANKRAAVDFPDLVPGTVTLSRARLEGHEIVVVRSQGGVWPTIVGGWTLGLVNRLDVQGATLYELAVNLGQIGPRATIIHRALSEAKARSSRPLIVDLGERDGDLGLERRDRARLDYAALSRLGYGLVVPYDFELALGAKALRDLRDAFPGIGFLAANVKAKDAELFEGRRVVEQGGATIGFFGLVDPDIQGILAKSSLVDFTFENPLDAAQREIKALREAGADAVVALSNLHPRENALIAREVMGLDAIIADLHVRWSPEAVRTEVVLPGRPLSRPGSPALVARSFANGLGVGRLDLTLRRKEQGGFYVASLSHTLESVTDRTPPDPDLVAEVRAMGRAAERPRGEVLLPAFGELVKRRPNLRAFDETSAQDRISKRMWEGFLARLVRQQGGAEVAILRKLPHFPPAIGDLREADIRAWLWTEDALVFVDLLGSDLKSIVAEDRKGDLVLNGLDRAALTVHGRAIADGEFYRVATTDLLLEGARFRAFAAAKRVRRRFRLAKDGRILPSGSGRGLPLRDYVLGELERLRARGGDEASLQRLARLLDRDPPFQPLLRFSFDHPTLFGSFSKAANNEAYGGVQDSRVTSGDTTVLGASGRFVLTQDRQRLGLDLGTTVNYSKQSATSLAGATTVSESADELKLDITARRKPRADNPLRAQPFLSASFSTEFSPTVNPQTGVANRRRKLLRGVLGLMLPPRKHWPTLQAGVLVEDDVALHNVELGLEAKTEYTRKLGSLANIDYRLRSAFDYFFPSDTDDAGDLGITYNMVHEVLIPFVGELSLSVAADVLVYKGKLPETSKLATNTILRLGITYNRLWKPRHQPFF